MKASAITWPQRIALAFASLVLCAGFAAQTTNPGVGKPWPLGLVTVATVGTPVQLTTLIVPGKPQCSQLWLKNTSGTATAYLMASNVAKDSTYSQVIYYMAPGEYIFISANALGQSYITPSNFYLDASANGTGVLSVCWQGN